jgi:glycosyltransferase involved in cell wall biosynthesis
MRIDLVITELDTGGAEKCCAELALFLKNRAHRVRIIALGPRPKYPKDALILWLEAMQIETHFLGGKRWWMLPSVVSKLRGLLKSDKPDLVQSFLWHANAVTAWVAPSLNIPFFSGVRVAEPRSFRHIVDRWTAGRSAKTICVSQGVADWCIRTEKLDARKLVVIPNGIAIQNTTEAIDSTTHDVPVSARVLLFVGRLEHQKGIDLLVQHGRKLMAQLPEHHLVLIGNGSMRPLVDSFAAEPGLRGRVHCLGQRIDVRAWMARSELLLLPTRYEGMPNVLLEAMAEGLPVVTNRVEGVAELLGEQLESQSSAKDNWESSRTRQVRPTIEVAPGQVE